MSTYVLVHGSWYGSWCWDTVVPLLEAKGHKAIALDLPGHGADKTPIPEITLDS
ncbi:MAG: alpha/beta fold hydrolase, partial [Nitrospinota bacterium]|nr:alpha/beta fold hydrolase [Nitrospinota bacterium]